MLKLNKLQKQFLFENCYVTAKVLDAAESKGWQDYFISSFDWQLEDTPNQYGFYMLHLVAANGEYWYNIGLNFQGKDKLTMLNLKNTSKKYYVIYENPSEYTSPRPVYIAEKLQEAEDHLMEYADWYCPRGTCQIRVVDKKFKALETRYYDEGKLREVRKGI